MSASVAKRSILHFAVPQRSPRALIRPSFISPLFVFPPKRPQFLFLNRTGASVKDSGSFRAMPPGNGSKSGKIGNVDSVTYRTGVGEARHLAAASQFCACCGRYASVIGVLAISWAMNDYLLLLRFINFVCYPEIS